MSKNIHSNTIAITIMHAVAKWDNSKINTSLSGLLL